MTEGIDRYGPIEWAQIRVMLFRGDKILLCTLGTTLATTSNDISLYGLRMLWRRGLNIDQRRYTTPGPVSTGMGDRLGGNARYGYINTITLLLRCSIRGVVSFFLFWLKVSNCEL